MDDGYNDGHDDTSAAVTADDKVKVDKDHQVVNPKVDEDGNQDKKVKLDQIEQCQSPGLIWDFCGL